MHTVSVELQCPEHKCGKDSELKWVSVRSEAGSPGTETGQCYLRQEPAMNRRVTESSYKKDECKRKREEEGEIDSHSKAGITELTWQQVAWSPGGGSGGSVGVRRWRCGSRRDSSGAVALLPSSASSSSYSRCSGGWGGPGALNNQ